MIVSCSFLSLGNKERKVYFKIWTDKNVYFQYEPIFAKYILKNETVKDIKIGQYWAESFSIYNSSGDRFFDCASYSIIPFKLKPGEKIENKSGWNIASEYCHRDSIGPKKVGYDFLPDIYNISSELAYYKSNIIQIKVVNPEGDEKDAAVLFEKGLYADSVETQIKYYNKLINEFPKSIYVPESLHLLSIKYQFHRDRNKKPSEDMVRCNVKLLKDYPDINRNYHTSAVNNLSKYFLITRTKKDEAINFFRHLKSDIRNRSIKKIISEKIEQIQKYKYPY